MAKKPNTDKEQLIMHVEFAAEFGQIANFDSYILYLYHFMSFVSFYMFDIIILFIILKLFIIAISFCVIIRLLKKLSQKAVSCKSNGSS